MYNRTIMSGASPLFQGPHWLGSLLRSRITTQMIISVVIEENMKYTTAPRDADRKKEKKTDLSKNKHHERGNDARVITVCHLSFS